MTRYKVLREFKLDDVFIVDMQNIYRMADEIVWLREQLRDTHTEVFHLGEKMAVIEQERDQFASMLHDCENERDGWKHRAERAERVVEAVRDYFNDAPNDNGLYSAWTAYTLATSNVRALDAEAQP